MTLANPFTHFRVSTHSRAEAAAHGAIFKRRNYAVSTHSRAEAAAQTIEHQDHFQLFQHTAARRRLRFINAFACAWGEFQHTAARRRLLVTTTLILRSALVSTHSRAEAAACRMLFKFIDTTGFNTQPRGGGCNHKHY